MGAAYGTQRGDKGRLGRRHTTSLNSGLSQAGGIEQVGCIYTAQGFEFDYAGIIFGLDLRFMIWDRADLGRRL